MATAPAQPMPPTLLKGPQTPSPNGKGDKWAEQGSIGLEAFEGFISKAYQTELRWPEVYPVYNRLRRSDPEMTVIRQIYAAVTGGVVLEWEPPEDADDTEQEATDFANEVMDDLTGGVAQFAQTYVAHVPFMGYGIWEIVPGLRKKGWTPPQDDPWRSKHDDGLIGIRRLAWRDHSTFSRWDLHQQTGRVIGFYQNDPPRPEIYLPSPSLLHVTWGDPNNPEGLAGLEPVHRLERIKFGLEVVQGIGYEHSSGHLSVTVEEGDLNSLKGHIQNAAKAIMSAQAGNYAAWPKGTKGELLDTPFSAAASILEAIRYYGILKMAVFNMQHIAMATLSGSGSYAAMQDSSAMWLVAFNAMMADLAAQVNEKLGPWLFDRNALAFPGLQRRPKFVARPLAKIIPLDALGTFATAWKAIEGLGPDDIMALRRISGILPEVRADDQGDVLKPEPPPVPAPADPAAAETAAEDALDDPASPEGADDAAAEQEAAKKLTMVDWDRLQDATRVLAEAVSALEADTMATARLAQSQPVKSEPASGPAPIIHNHIDLPEPASPAPSTINVYNQLPAQQPTPITNDVTVNVPPQPEQPAPVVNVTVEPAQVQSDVTVRLPAVEPGPAPVVNVTVVPAPLAIENTVVVPKIDTQATTVQRDADGEITGSTSTYEYKE